MTSHTPESLASLSSYAATKFGTKTAVVSEDVELTFEQVNDQVNALAFGLDKLGFGRGDHILLHLPNGWRWIVCYYAIARIGAVIVPSDYLLVPEEIRFIADNCQAAGAIVSADRYGQIASLLAGSSTKILSFGDGSSGDSSLDVFLGRPVGAFISPNGDRQPDDISTIMYTSGTTGQPKGAVLTDRAVLLNAQVTATMHVRTAQDITVMAVPCAHVYGSIIMNGCFLTGAKLVLMDRFDVRRTLAAIEEHKATLFEGVPTMYHYLMDSELPEQFELSSLSRCTVGGQTMAVGKMEEVERRLGCRLIEIWGMTEIGGLGTTHPAYGPPKLGSIGVPMPFMECRIASLENPSQSVPDGELGELMFRGPIVMESYWALPEATNEILGPDGWLRTGDVGYKDEDGYYYIVDRKKEMIITAGYNVYPSEVERAVAEHPGVAMVAVGSVFDPQKGELAKAYIVRKQGARCDEGEIMLHCRERLAQYKLPRLIEFVEDLPRTSTGKMKRGSFND